MARPRDPELARRRDEFLRALTRKPSIGDALRTSGMDEKHFVRLIDETEFWLVLVAVREGRIGPTAVIAEPPVESQAAA